MSDFLAEYGAMLLQETAATLEMSLISTLFAYIIEFP